jgi:3-mercaptopyruvate sulfurtransferase SseA
MNKISKEKAIKLVQKGAKLVDIRSPVSYRDGTIPGAVNLPFKNFLNRLLSVKPTEKIIIFSDRYTDEDLKNILKYADELGKLNCIFVSTYKDLL